MSESSASTGDARLELYDIMRQDVAFEQKAEQALALGEEYLGVDNAHLTHIDQETDYWEAIVSTDPPDGDFPPGLVLDVQTTYCRRVLDDGDSIALHDASEQGWADDPAFEEHGLQCYHGTPISLGEEPYGTVCFVSEAARDEPFSESDTLFAELIGRLLEQELQTQHLQADATRRSNAVAVLSRVLRHNLRNEMTVVRGRINALAEEVDDDTYLSEALFDSIDSIISLSDKARKLETVVSTQFDREPVALQPLLDRAITDLTIEYPAAEVRVEGPTDLTIEAMSSLELAVEELLENAVKHADDDPDVVVSVTATDDIVELAISDSGPGLPSQEQAVLAEGAETPLVHGSGLGLWMVYWIVSSHDGTIDATTTDDGTTVTVTLPRVGTDDDGSPAGDVQALQQGFDRFQAVFEDSFDGMVIVNDDRRIIDANERAAGLFECPKQDLLGRRMAEFAGEGFDTDEAWRAIQGSGHSEGRFPMVGAEGTERTLEYSASADIVPGQHLLIGRDITDRIERERELERTTHQLEALLETVEAAVFIKDRKGRYQLMNEECRTLLGIDPDTAVGGLTDADIFPEDVAEQIRAHDQQVLESGEPLEIEEEIPTPDGPRTFLTLKAPFYDEGGTIVGVCAVSTDITERKQREQRLRETTQQLQGVFRASPDPILALDANGIIQLWNEAAETVFGYPAEEAVGTPITELQLVGEDQLSGFAERFERVMDGETFTGLEVTRQTSDGEPVHLRLSTAPLRANDGTVTGVMAFARDVTEQEERERDLERRERRYHTLAEQFPNGAVLVFDRDLVYRSAHGEAFEYGALDAETVEGSHIEAVFDGEMLEQKRAMYEATLDGETCERELTFRGRDYRVTTVPIRDDSGQVLEGLVMTQDVTEYREQARALREQAERLEDVASTVSHDVKNPLNVLAGALELAEQTGDPDHFEDCYWALERVEEVVDEQLAVARAEKTVEDREAIELGAVVAECWRAIEAADAELVVETEQVVRAERERLQQLLENLLGNAVTHGGPDVTVTVGDLDDGFYVADDGPGIPPDERSAVFERGYTTDEQSTGLGLAIVTDIVEAHDWTIAVRESTAGGARFEIRGVDTVE